MDRLFKVTCFILLCICDHKQLIKLKRKDLRFELDTHLYGCPYIDLFLLNCKGWQRRLDKKVIEADLSSVFPSEISQVPNLTFVSHQAITTSYLPSLSCLHVMPFHWLTLWIQYLQSVHYGHLLNPNDYIFSAMGANGIVQLQEQISYDTVQNRISKATTGAEIHQASGGSSSTHCFCQGGAQYRFMYTPVSKNWNLAIV